MSSSYNSLGYLLEKEPAVGVLQLPETLRRPLEGSQDQLPLPGLGVPEESKLCENLIAQEA